MFRKCSFALRCLFQSLLPSLFFHKMWTLSNISMGKVMFSEAHLSIILFSNVVQAIQHKSCPNTSFGFIIADCLDVLQHLVDVQVVYARRSANSAAHCLANGACSFTSLHIWGYTPPQCILSCLHYDV